MNIRSQLNPWRVARLALRHAEKGLFALALLFLFACIFRASRRETLPWTPEDLEKWAEAAATHLEATRPPQLRIERYSETASRSVRPVSASSYALSGPFDAPLRRIEKRSGPDVFPVRALLASAGRGAFAAVAGGSFGDYATQGVRGERWVCLTGLIDQERQKAAFRNALWQTSYRNVQRDRPEYIYFRVERAEVDPRRPGEPLHWVRQHVRNMLLRQQTWPQYGTELVDPRSFPPQHGDVSLVYPLGPLVDRPWGPEVSHPGIPLEEEKRAVRPSVARRAKAGQALASAQESLEEPDYLLFRYFDFEVAPGKQYRYRVRLVLANPNYGVPVNYLEDESTAKVRYLETEWSEPTDVAQVPSDTEVLAGPAKTWGTPAKVMLTKFLISTGKVAFEEFEVGRGQLLDFAGRVFDRQTATVPVAQVPFTTEGMAPPAYAATPAEDRFKEPTKAPPRGVVPGAEGVGYSSGMMLLDVRGGGRMRGPDRFKEPASLLLMDALGNLVVRSEMEDLPQYRSYQRAARPPEGTYAGRRPALTGPESPSISLE